jgi:hypothetical protein
MAAPQTSVDAMLADAVSKLDGLTKRMDALETKPGSNNPIKGDDDDDKRDDGKSKSDDDDDRRDDGSRAKGDDDDDDKKKDDASTAPKTKILDDAKASSKGDAAVSPAPMKGDKKSDDDKKDDAAAKKSDDDDDKKDDAFPPPKKGKKADDGELEIKHGKEKDDSARADEIGDLRRSFAETQSTIKRLEALMKPRSDDEHAAFADAQARADGVFAGFGQRAPRPLDGEALFDYRKRLATKLKSYSPVWKSVKFSQLPEEAFGIAETQVYADAAAAAANPSDLEAGELRMVTKIDPATGVRSNVFYGKESFVKSMGRPGRRVASFRTLAST